MNGLFRLKLSRHSKIFQHFVSQELVGISVSSVRFYAYLLLKQVMTYQEIADEFKIKYNHLRIMLKKGVVKQTKNEDGVKGFQ